MLTVDFQARIKAILAERGMKQADLARLTGFETGKLNPYFTGKVKPTLDAAVTIAVALGITLDELVGLNPQETTQEKELLRMFRELGEGDRQEIVDYTEFKHAKKFLRERSSKEAGENYKGA